MKKQLICSILLISLVFCACDTYTVMGMYPYNESPVWYCTEIDFTLRFTSLENGDEIVQNHILNIDDESINVEVLFHAGDFAVWINSGSDTAELDDKLLGGTWEYQNGNLVFSITEDNLLGGKYEKLTFTPQVS